MVCGKDNFAEFMAKLRSRWSHEGFSASLGHEKESRGEAPLDVDAEVAALLKPRRGEDAELREEVRQLVIARNERRVRRGEEPLDVETEVDRQLRDLGA